MKTTVLITVIVILSSFSLLYGAYTTVFDQSFNVSSPPANWSIQGYVGTSHTTTGTAKTNTDLFKNNGDNNYLRLTENTGYNRAWAYYTGSTFDIMGKWKLTAEVRIGKTHDGSESTVGADGLCFAFMDAATVESSPGVLDMAKVEGGYGEFEGTSRGSLPNQPVTGSKGYHAGVKGFSLEFDHYNNTGELFREYIHWVDLEHWVHSGLGHDMATDTNFYYNDGWKKIQIEANAGVITFSYNWTGSAYSNSVVIDATNPSVGTCNDIYSYQAYLGVCSSTGGASAFHEVRNFKLETDEETLPVQLSSLTAVQTNSNLAQINWTTQTETGLAGFRVLRNTSANLVSAIVVSPLIEASNTSQTQNYSYLDSEVYPGQSLYYWLQSQEISGELNHSNPVMLTISEEPVAPPVIDLVTGIKDIYPNPFNPDLAISYTLKETGSVKLDVVNIRGQLIRVLDQDDKAAGSYKLHWDGKDEQGSLVASGVYYIRMDVAGNRFVKRAVLLK